MLYLVLKHTSSLSVLAPIIAVLFKWKAFNAQLKALFLFLMASALADTVGFYRSSNGQSTVSLFYYYTIIEGLLILTFYYFVFESARTRKVFAAIFFFYLITALIIYTWKFQLDRLTSIECAMILSISSAFIFKAFFSDDYVFSTTTSYLFWINSAFFLYFGINFFYLSFESIVRYSNPLFRNFSIAIHMVTSIVFNVLIAIGICKKTLTSS